MGGGSWNSNAYKAASTTRAKKGIDDFEYHTKVVRGEAKGIHPSLDPKKVAGPTSEFAGQVIRESRDSDEHPDSIPIAIVFDVTGSMGGIPRRLQQKLADLMDVVIAKSGIEHPQVLVGAVGDSYSDQYPFQIGQFESDNRFDEQLRNIILEGGGGGQSMESYGLAYFFAARHTHTDSFTKRGKKGYLFTMGDELPWDKVTAAEIKQIFGLPAEIDVPIEDLIKEAQEKWEIFHLWCNDGSYRNRTEMIQKWRDLLGGERVVIVERSDMVCEIIAGIVHGLETAATSLGDVVTDLDLDAETSKVVTSALSGVISASGSLPEADEASATTTV